MHADMQEVDPGNQSVEESQDILICSCALAPLLHLNSIPLGGVKMAEE